MGGNINYSTIVQIILFIEDDIVGFLSMIFSTAAGFELNWEVEMERDTF
jgi:hypothetical protein